MQPLVTIAIPVYNEEKYIEETILSALNQSYPNIEIIISDNASTDNSWRIIQKVKNSNFKIRIIRQSENLGVHENFDFLKKNGNGKYFMWLGGHDIVHSEFIREAVLQMERNEDIVLYYPTAVLFDSDVRNPKDININADLNTFGLQYKERMLKIIDNLGACYALHGLSRKEIMDCFEFEKDGTDHLFLLRMSFFGHLIPSPDTRYYARKVREENSYKDQLERLKTFGYKKDFPLYCTLSHFKNIFYWDKIRNFKVKLNLIERIYQVFAFTICRLTIWKMMKHLVITEFHPRLFFFVLWFKIKNKLKGNPHSL